MQARPASKIRFWISLGLLASFFVAPRPTYATGTWTAAPSSATNNGPAFGLWLLTDGRVLSHGKSLQTWVILTPDKTGNYANGSWKSVAASNFSRGGAQEHVLKDGRFMEAGGEYIYAWPAHDGVAACTPTQSTPCTNPPSGSPLYKNVETYDPVADAWTIQPDAPYDIGDTGSATLPDGRILDSTRGGPQTQIFDPSTNTWSTGLNNVNNQNGDEASWASLQNGGVLAVQPKYATVYDPSTGKWIATGALPSGLAVTLTAASGYPGTFDFGDTAGISLMFDGRVLAYGLGTTAIYTPGATGSSPGTWALGPDLPYKTGPLDGTPGNECEDGYTITEPNGKVMVATHPFGMGNDTLLEFDPTSNTFAAITPSSDSSPYPFSNLNLPSGQVLITGGSRDWLYTPDSQPQDAWRPTVSSVTYDSSASNYTLTGTQLSGLINGGDEGDDMTMAENYPIVWLKDTSNNVYYCKSFNFSLMAPQAGTAPQTCQFTTPASLPSGSYSLYVSSVGVQSKNPFPFTVGQSTTTGTGGTSGTGGTTGPGGATGAGGTGTGGTTGSGGTTTGSGGNTGTGGSSTGTGGATGSGGNTGTGGSAIGTGGTTGSGGATGNGGATGSGGGSGNAGTGGAAAGSGGSSGEAGVSSGCSCETATAGSPGKLGALGTMSLFGLALVVGRRRRVRR